MAANYKVLKNGGFIPQKQKNNFSLRIHVVGGNLSVEKLKKVYEIAEKYGSGYVHLTSRQSVEIPFIKLDDIESIKEELEKGGCKPAVCGPGVRTVTACQGNIICSSGNINAYEIAEKIDQRYAGKELPHKFKFGVTGCRNNCLKAEENDLGIKGGVEVEWEKEKCVYCGICERVCKGNAIKVEKDQLIFDRDQCIYCGKCVNSCPKKAWSGKIIYMISFGGTFGNAICEGESIIPNIKSEEQLYRVADAAIEFFKNHGKKLERFRFTIERIGWQKFKEVIEEAYYQDEI